MTISDENWRRHMMLPPATNHFIVTGGGTIRVHTSKGIFVIWEAAPSSVFFYVTDTEESYTGNVMEVDDPLKGGRK